jgi:hypothetical protein
VSRLCGTGAGEDRRVDDLKGIDNVDHEVINPRESINLDEPTV